MKDVENFKIQKQNTKFLWGAEKTYQLEEWFGEHPSIKGIAFIGRSNVGKSSLINAIFGSKTARVSKTPGRTRQVNIFEFFLTNEKDHFGPYYLFDLPGYGHAEVSKAMLKEWTQLLEMFFTLSKDQVQYLNIQDARHPLQAVDLQFMDYLASFESPLNLILNKSDKLKTQKDRAKLKKQTKEMREKFKKIESVTIVSAEKRTGVDQLCQVFIPQLVR